MENTLFEQKVPYIKEKENSIFEVVFIEPGTRYSCYEFNNLRDAKICVTEVKPLVIAAANAGLINPSMISDEEWEIEPIVTELTDEYGFRTVTTEYYKGETVIVIYNEVGEVITPEQKQAAIDAIEEEKRRQEEIEASKLSDQLD